MSDTVLDELLAPMSADTFFASYWKKQPIHIEGQRYHRFTSVFHWWAVNQILTFWNHRAPDVKLTVDGRVYDPSAGVDVLQACQEGATLVLNNVDRKIAPVADISAQLQRELGIGYRIQTNAYISWPGTQGFAQHWDHHDVLVLQVAGSKQWRLYGASENSPLDSKIGGGPSEPVAQPFLRAGDVLYVPRGEWHDAIATTEPSIHLTVGLYATQGIHFVEWLTDRLKADPAWCRDVLDRVQHPDAPALAREIESLAAGLSEAAGAPGLAREFGVWLEQQNTRERNYALPFQAGHDTAAFGAATVFRRPEPPQLLWWWREGSDAVEVVFGKRHGVFEGLPERLLTTLQQETEFTGNQLWALIDPEADWSERVVPVLAVLVGMGVLMPQLEPMIDPQQTPPPIPSQAAPGGADGTDAD
jgi:ribosomal protein L16 Arg81 hydroxylase